MEKQHYINQAAENLRRGAEIFQSAAREFERYAKEVEAGHEDALAWAINHAASGVLNNLRLDVLAGNLAMLKSCDKNRS